MLSRASHEKTAIDRTFSPQELADAFNKELARAYMAPAGGNSYDPARLKQHFLPEFQRWYGPQAAAAMAKMDTALRSQVSSAQALTERNERLRPAGYSPEDYQEQERAVAALPPDVRHQYEMNALRRDNRATAGINAVMAAPRPSSRSVREQEEYRNSWDNPVTVTPTDFANPVEAPTSLDPLPPGAPPAATIPQAPAGGMSAEQAAIDGSRIFDAGAGKPNEVGGVRINRATGLPFGHSPGDVLPAAITNSTGGQEIVNNAEASRQRLLQTSMSGLGASYKPPAPVKAPVDNPAVGGSPGQKPKRDPFDPANATWS
jgi:hypothetical protein